MRVLPELEVLNLNAVQSESHREVIRLVVLWDLPILKSLKVGCLYDPADAFQNGVDHLYIQTGREEGIEGVREHVTVGDSFPCFEAGFRIKATRVTIGTSPGTTSDVTLECLHHDGLPQT